MVSALSVNAFLEVWTERNMEGGTEMPRNKHRKGGLIKCKQGKHIFCRPPKILCF